MASSIAPRSRQIKLRPASAADVERIAAIAAAAYALYVPRLGRKPAPMVADFAGEVSAGHVVVADGLEGYMIAWAEPATGTYFIDNLAIDPAHQGKGLGRRFLEHAAAEARRLGLSAVRLYTNIVMTENQALYTHIGFVETHRAQQDGFDRIFYRWDLP